MENVLRAGRDGTVKILHAKPGDSLRVDQKIFEFAWSGDGAGHGVAARPPHDQRPRAGRRLSRLVG